jgi:Tol biopolymer transport system component
VSADRLAHWRTQRKPIGAVGTLVCLAIGISLVPASAQAAYPGRNGKIAYAESDGAISNGSTSSLASIWSSGRGARPLAFGGVDPAFSPSGRTLAFADEFGFGISITRPEGRRVRRVTRGSDSNPDFAPSGRRIVFERYPVSGPQEIRIYHAGRTRLLTRGNSPAWSPGGGAIAFTRTLTDGTQRTGIYTIGPDGRNLRLVTVGFDPDWSPSGRTLGFVITPGRLATIRPSGAGFRRLTRRPIYSHPAFSPDGRAVAALRSNGDGQDLVTINLRTRRLRSVLFPDDGFTSGIDWQPLRRR